VSCYSSKRLDSLRGNGDPAGRDEAAALRDCLFLVVVAAAVVAQEPRRRQARLYILGRGRMMSQKEVCCHCIDD
jgi:hypothetical protein